jgi:hypothetical protein
MSVFIIALEGDRPPAVSQMLKTLFAADCANENTALVAVAAGGSPATRRPTGKARAFLLERLSASDLECRPWSARSAPFLVPAPSNRDRAADLSSRRRAPPPMFGPAAVGNASLYLPLMQRPAALERRRNVSTAIPSPYHAGLRLEGRET